MFRYMAFVWSGAIQPQCEAMQVIARRLQSNFGGWREILGVTGLRVLCSDTETASSAAYPLHGQAGAVLGTLFGWPENVQEEYVQGEANTSRRPTLGAQETERILASGGRYLMRCYWGRYVAFLVDTASDRKWVLREPVGNLPCYYAQFRGVTIFFSHMADCLQLDLLRFTINWRHISMYVTAGRHYAQGTALNEVSQMYGGECIEVCRERMSKSLYWHPFAATQLGVLENAEKAMRALRSTTKACTHAWASCHESILLQASGGLDSSIVLGCLADAPTRPRVTCVTYFLPGGNSDERPYARRAVKRAGCGHIEQPRDVRLDFTELLQLAPSPKPAPNLAFLEFSHFERRLAQEKQASAVFNGVGGDYLFCGTSIQLGATDYVWRHGIRLRLFRIASDVALRANRSVWSILGEAVRDGLFQKEWSFPKEVLRRRKLAHMEVLEAIARETRLAHPWLQSTDDVPRGMLFMMMALSSQPFPFYDPLSRAEDPYPENVSPLLSQPVAELCLSIPSYVHIQGGRDRALARRAFAHDVPRENLAREWKDRAVGIGEAALMSNLRFVRELLLDGILVKEKLLDRDSLEEALSPRPTRKATYALHIFSHLTTEIWLREWVSAQASGCIANARPVRTAAC